MRDLAEKALWSETATDVGRVFGHGLGCPCCGFGGAEEPEFTILPSSGTASNGKIIFSYDEAAAQLTRSGNTWSSVQGQGITVSYAFRSTAPATMPSGTTGFVRFSDAQILAAETSLALWADVCGIVFARAGSGTAGEGAYSDDASILFANYTTETSPASGFAFLPTPGATAASNSSGDIWIDRSDAPNAAPVFGDFGPHVLAHEIGHAIGLRHPGNYNGESPTYETEALYWQDARMFTVMSYFGSTNTGGNLPAFSWGPQLHDIAAAQRLYGANMTTRTGDTVYGFNSTADRNLFTITSAAQGAVFAIWDAGGNDTLDLSGYSENAEIDLRAESFTSAGPTPANGPARYNIAIARGVTIENAIGGAGNDMMTGNAAANRLVGNAGADTLDGMGGADTLDGGAGDDRYVLRSGTETLVDSSGFDEVTLLVSGPTSYTLPTGLEILNVSSAVSIVVANGNSVDNFITANAGNTELYGFDGNDRLFGSVGNNRLEGGTGIDLLFGSDGNDALFGQIGDDRLEGEAGNDLAFCGEGADVFIGGTGADQAFGENGVDLLFGGSGADILLGEFGDDRLFGEFDNDLLFGGVGADEMQGEQGDDRLFGDVGGDIMFGQDGADELQGENDNDRLFGGFGTDIMFGQAGDDELQGEQDNDRLFGGFGADIMFGQDGADELQGEQDNDRLFGGTGADIMFGQDGADELQGEEDNDRLFGGLGADQLLGQAGADELQGEEGADRLSGGSGNDTLVGGADADVFLFAAGSGADTLLGFEDGLDLLDLRGYAGATFANTTIVQQGANTLVTFVGGDTVLLMNFTATNLDAADFLFT
jgi:serralysin